MYCKVSSHQNVCTSLKKLIPLSISFSNGALGRENPYNLLNTNSAFTLDKLRNTLHSGDFNFIVNAYIVHTCNAKMHTCDFNGNNKYKYKNGKTTVLNYPGLCLNQVLTIMQPWCGLHTFKHGCFRAQKLRSLFHLTFARASRVRSSKLRKSVKKDIG